jgi:hypothetical protein
LAVLDIPPAVDDIAVVRGRGLPLGEDGVLAGRWPAGALGTRADERAIGEHADDVPEREEIKPAVALGTGKGAGVLPAHLRPPQRHHGVTGDAACPRRWVLARFDAHPEKAHKAEAAARM